jgi:hypothetical protein
MDEAKQTARVCPCLNLYRFQASNTRCHGRPLFRQPLFNVRTALSQCTVVVITGAGGLTDKIDESLRSLVATAKGGSVI